MRLNFLISIFLISTLFPFAAVGAGKTVIFDENLLIPYFTDKEIIQGVEEINDGKFEQALVRFEKALEKNPLMKNDKLLRFLAGFAAFNIGNYTKTKSFLESLEEKYAAMEEEILFMRGVSNLKQGLILEAVRDLSAVKSLNSNRKEVFLSLIEALYASDRKQDAFAMLDEYRLKFGQDKEFAALFEKIAGEKVTAEIQDKPADVLSAARRYFLEHRNKEVIKIASVVQKESPKGSELWCEAGYLTARSYDKQKKYSQSVPIYTELCAWCMKSFQFPEIVLNGVRAFVRNGKVAEGERCFADFQTTNPSHTYNDDIMVYFARVYSNKDNKKKALAIIEEQLKKYPEGDMAGEARFMIIWELYKERRYKKGIVEIEKAEKFKDNWSYYTNGRLLYWKGRMFEKIKKKREAEKAYLQCLDEYPLSYYALLSSSRLIKISKIYKVETLYASLEKKRPFKRKFIELLDPETIRNKRLSSVMELFRLGLTKRALYELKLFYNDTSVNASDREWITAYLYDRYGHYSISHVSVKQSTEYEQSYPTGDSALFYKLLYPTPYKEIVDRYAAKYRVDPLLIYAVMREESGFNSRIVSWAGAIGLLQLIPPTAQRMAKGIYQNSVADKLTDPEVNINLGVKYLRYLTKLLKHPFKVIAAYNAGEGSVISWEKKMRGVEIDEFVEEIAARETRYYVKRVLQSYYRYKYLYGKEKDRYLKF